MTVPGKKKKVTTKEVTEFIRIFEKICGILGKYKNHIVSFSKENARKMKLKLVGKQIAVIGPVAAGKTTLLHVLKNHSIIVNEKSYAKTTDAAIFTDKLPIEWKLPIDDTGKVEVIRLKIRKPKDVGGEPALRDDAAGWLDVCKESNFIFYLFDASACSEDGVVLNRIRDDFKWISNHGQDFAAGFKIVMFANKTDKLKGRGNGLGKFEQQHLVPIVKATRKALGPYKNHLVLVSPCCLLSDNDRNSSISSALKHLADISL